MGNLDTNLGVILNYFRNGRGQQPFGKQINPMVIVLNDDYNLKK